MTARSHFTLNHHHGQHPKGPTMKGRLGVLDIDGTLTDFEVAAFGPFAAKTSGREWYGVEITPADPALAARATQHLRGQLPLPPTPNAHTDLELTLGRGLLFPTTEAEKQRALALGRKAASFRGAGLVLLPSGPRAIDLWLRYVDGHGFHSGFARDHDPQAAAAARAARVVEAKADEQAEA